jgi:hypothetical protein
LLFAEAKPDFADDFSKSAAKVRLFFEIAKYFSLFSHIFPIFKHFTSKSLAIYEELFNFAHDMNTVQY